MGRKSRWLILAAMAVTGVWVVAQPPGGGTEGKKGGPGGMPPHPLMEALDLDKDGKISAEEIKKAPQSLLKLDKNGDGELTRNEVRPSFSGMGKNGPEGKGFKGGPQGKNGAPEGKGSGPERPPLEKPDPQNQAQLQASPNPLPEAIAWYTDLEAGLAEAKRTDKPILLMSAAPSCSGVSGVW